MFDKRINLWELPKAAIFRWFWFGYISIGGATALYGFRPYGGSLLANSPKRNQKGLAPAYGLRCAQVPSLQFRCVGTP